MNSHEMNTISARFANKIWNHPTTGEERLYINGIARAVKIWLVADEKENFGYKINYYLNHEYGWNESTVYFAIDQAKNSLELMPNASFSDILTAMGV